MLFSMLLSASLTLHSMRLPPPAPPVRVSLQDKPSLRVQVIGAGPMYFCLFAIRQFCSSDLGLLSAGNHVPGQVVTWTGTTNVRHKVIGVTINWYDTLCFSLIGQACQL